MFIILKGIVITSILINITIKGIKTQITNTTRPKKLMLIIDLGTITKTK